MDNQPQQQNYRQELTIALDLAKQATIAILEIYYGNMETTFKEDNSPVTNADIKANEIIQSGLQKAFPLDGIVSEELQDITTNNNRVWYIDPIDGTRSFTEHSDQFAIHIGLTENTHPVFGLVYKPVSGEYYYGIKNHGAYRVSPTGIEKKLEMDTLFNLKNLNMIIDKSSLLDERWRQIYTILNPKRLMVSGSEGLRIMKLAENIANLHITEDPSKCSTWDICAPQIIAQEAGAHISYLDYTPITYHQQRKINKQVIVAANQQLAEYVTKVINNIQQ